jgi:hypothetical protein
MRHPFPPALAIGLVAIFLTKTALAQFPVTLDRVLPIDARAHDVLAFDNLKAHVVLNQIDTATAYTFAADFQTPSPSTRHRFC